MLKMCSFFPFFKTNPSKEDRNNRSVCQEVCTRLNLQASLYYVWCSCTEGLMNMQIEIATVYAYADNKVDLSIVRLAVSSFLATQKVTHRTEMELFMRYACYCRVQ